MKAKPTTIGRREIEYPCCDDQPMTDSDANKRRMDRTASAIEEAYRRRGTTAYVSKDTFVYPVEGHPEIRNAPDILVAPGCEQGDRLSFKCWEEPGGIEFAGEFLQITQRERLDSPKLAKKVRFYRERLRTRELFLYEPKGQDPADGFEFRFLRLTADGEYTRVEPNDDGWYKSQVLGLLLRPAPLQLDLMDPITGERYLSDPERAEAQKARADAAEERAQAAEEAARASQAEIARLRAQLEERGSKEP